MGRISLLTLGTLRCHVGEVELTELPAQRLRCAVLLYLAVEREATREAAASLFWPERTDERARHALSQKLYELRHILGDAWLSTAADRMRVSDDVSLDVHAFETAVQREAWEQALELYRGDFVAGFFVPESKDFEQWVDRHRSRLARMHRKARVAVIDACLAAGDHGTAIVHARRWVELEPLEDEAQHRLIELLGLAGQRAEAIRQYESYERMMLAEELEPLDATRELIARVRQSSSSHFPPPTFGSSVRAATVPPPPKRQIVAVAAIVTLLLLTVGAWSAWHERSAVHTRGMAVLPFLNLSTDTTASDHLSDGIADELISILSRTQSLQVAARTSSFRFKNKDTGIRAIGDSLGVSLLLEGSLRREGERLRVTAKLINVKDGYTLWSDVFDRDFTDAISVQQEIAGAIVEAMQVRLAGTERALLGLGGTSNAQAYDWYLRGRYALNKGTRPAIRTAISSFDSAIAYDPRYAKAYANVAEAHVIGAANRELDPEESLPIAVASAQRAIALAPGLSEGHAALGRAELELWHWKAAESEVVRAVRLDPRNAAAHATYAKVLMVRGRLKAAAKEAETAMHLEPLSATITHNYAESLRALRKYEQSAKFYRKGIELEPELGRQNLAKVYIEMALYDSARAQFRGALAAGAPRMRNAPVLWSAYINARAGNRAEAQQLAQEFQDRTPRGPNSYMLAAVYLSVGNYDRALQLAEIGVQDRNMPAWRQLPWDPIWNPVRHDERFVRVLQQMGI